jgi:D-sedoheptulose 7-phosphate isomerase
MAQNHDQVNDPLQQLYPFLHGGKKDAASENAVLLESVQQKAQHSLDIKQQFFADNAQALIEAAGAVAKVYQHQGRIFTMGNGGSSCDAAHFAVEFQHPVTAGRPALPAMNLCVDTAMISAVSNDVGLRHVFVRQLDAHAQANDGVVGFSTSGNSDNLMEGYRKAKELDLITVGFAGGDGGKMKSSGLVDHCLVVATDSIHRVQEVHVACYHILWDLVHTLLADQRGRLVEDKADIEVHNETLNETDNEDKTS